MYNKTNSNNDYEEVRTKLSILLKDRNETVLGVIKQLTENQEDVDEFNSNTLSDLHKSLIRHFTKELVMILRAMYYLAFKKDFRFFISWIRLQIHTHVGYLKIAAFNTYGRIVKKRERFITR